MVIVDNIKNIQRIIDRIKSDTSIISTTNDDGLLRSVQFGNPKQMKQNIPDINGMNYAYVTTDDSLQKTSYTFGISSPTNLSQISVGYKIVVVTHARDNQVNAEKQQYNLLTKMRTLLTTDPTFKDPVSDDDPIFTRSIINESRWNTKTKGTLFQVVEFSLLATIGAAFTATFPGIGDVILLSKPNAPEGIIFSDDREQKPTPNRVITENGDFGALFVEYESTVSLDDSFRAKFGLEEDVIITSASGAHVYHVQYIDINPTAQFDAIERTVLHMEIIPV